MPRGEFNDLSLAELTQFAFAKGEETVMQRSGQSDAVYTAIDAAFSKDPGQVLSEYWTLLLSRVNYSEQRSEQDYLEHNSMIAEQLTSQELS